MTSFRGVRVAILGLSVEGLDSVKFFAKQNAKILCCDQRSARELGQAYDELKRLPVVFQLGKDYLNNLDAYEVIVRTAGMSLRLPEITKLHQKGKEITSLTKLFFNLCLAPIIGVTGTKGKGTTSTLIYEMLKASGKKVYLGGNVGTPLLSQVGQIKASDLVVLELSSFQLEDLTKSPQIAVVLRTTQEHLANYDILATNFHPSKEAYIEAKKAVVRYQSASSFAVLNADDPVSRSFSQETKATVYYFGSDPKEADAYVVQHAVFLRWDNKTELICKANETKLRGDHNLENIAAASLAAKIAGANLAVIRQIARKFPGLEHRLELVRNVAGVSYYDDSFSTVPETTIAAVKSFTEPTILILGGSEKGSDFTQMGKIIVQRPVKAVIVVGMMTERILSALRAADYQGIMITGCKSMPEMVKKAQGLAAPGDVVLLSPACASFDMFKNYKDRGNQFKYEISLL